MINHEKEILKQLTKEELIYLIEKMDYSLTLISEVCVQESKWHIESKDAVKEIRDYIFCMPNLYNVEELKKELDIQMKEWQTRQKSIATQKLEEELRTKLKTITQEYNKEKIIELINKSKTMKLDDVINNIKEMFPEEEYKWEHIYDENYFYVKHSDILFLTNQTVLIIDYPGGDKLGSKLSDPYTNIYFENLILKEKMEHGNEMYLFLKNEYNSENIIHENIDKLFENQEMSIDVIIFHLQNAYDSLPMELLNQITEKQLQNKHLRKTIAESLRCVAVKLAQDAYDQYMYSPYGGEDVPEWKLSKKVQFDWMLEEFPEIIKETCKNELEEARKKLNN